MLRAVRRFAFSTVVLAAGGAGLTPTTAVPLADGTELIRSMASAMTAVLGQGQPQAVREERFRSLYRAHFDVPSINAWVMGPAWQQASPAQKHELSTALASYFVRSYTTHLGAYSGQRLQVQGSEPDGEAMIITSQIAGGSGGGINVKWLRKAGTGFKVRDVMVANVSMAMNLRREFAAMYQQAGSVDALLMAMRSNTRR